MRTTPVPIRAAILVATLLLMVALLPAPASSAPSGPLQLITRTVNGGANGDGSPLDISDDGRYVLYSSESSGLIEGFVDRNGTGPDVFLYDTETGETQLVSHRFGSTVETGIGTTLLAKISGDGNYVALQSVADDLADGQGLYDDNNATDTFLWNRQTDTMTVLSRVGPDDETCTDDGAVDNVNSNQLSISDDGAYVAFASTCNNLAPPFEAPTDGDNDIFLYSRDSGTTVNISQSGEAVQPGDSNGPVVSANGQYVAFYSSNATLAGTAVGTPSDNNNFDDVFRYTVNNGSLFVASQSQLGNTTGNGASTGPSISDDGQRVAFVSEANNLYGGSDTNGSADVFLWALDGGAFTRRLISQANEPGDPDSANAQSGGGFGPPNISGDGESIVYGTQATNLVEIGTKSPAGGADTVVDLVHHAVTLEQVGGVPTNPQANGTDTLITRNVADTDGGDGNSFNASRHATISDDGTEVVFLSSAGDLALPPGQSGPFNSFDAYLWEIGQGTRLVSATPSGQAGDDTSGNIVLSGDGDSLAIHSLAEDLTDDEYIANPNVRNVFIQNGPPLGDDLTLSVSDETVTEGPSGSLTPMTFTISLSQASTAEITVDYATADVTTNFGPDYGAREGTLTFAPGETTKTVEISVSGDDVEEPTETFEFRLSNPSPPATLSPTGATGIGTILDDDGGVQTTGAGVNDTIFVTTSSNSETALALSQATFADGATPRGAGGPSDLPTAAGALIATDGGFADALSSGSLQADRPLLLTATDSLYPSVIAELDRLGVTDVTILGGIVAISQSVEDELRTLGYSVTRYQGPSRLETATATAEGRYPTATTAVLARAFPAQGGPESQAFADSLAAGALAASNGWPLILTQTEVLSTSTRNYIDTSALETIYVVGGEAAISDSVINGIAEFAINTIRLEGPSRFETALAIAGQRGYAGEGDASRVMLLDGTADNAWAAGFAGAAHSAINGAPVVLGAADQVPGTTRDWLAGMTGPSTPRFTVDEDNITGPVLVCAIADERCLESRITLGLPELGETELSTPTATRGQTLSVDVSVEESATVNVTGSCLNPTSATPVTSGTTPLEISVPGEANQGPCDVTVSIDFPNGTRHTLIEVLTIAP